MIIRKLNNNRSISPNGRTGEGINSNERLQHYFHIVAVFFRTTDRTNVELLDGGFKQLYQLFNIFN